MYSLSVNIWFQKLMKQFFFGIDQVVYNFISYIYDLLISIARTSVLSQADILDMADRIYKLLAIFMIFKVTLSLITYVVNPDDFADKSKGMSKLVTNIVISLGLLILTPYIFSMAYRLQTIILEDNTLATLIFAENEESTETTAGDFINTAGDEIAFVTMSAFFSPNTSITELQNCIDLYGDNGKVNPECSGLSEDYSKDTSKTSSLASITPNITDVQNYVAGVDNKNLGLMFRQEIAVATTTKNEFIMEYKYVFSTVVGVVVVLLLISFCMDVALRSIKLSFLQLIAPIPILSYVDPKSGKDGMFKKWYTLCFKTYLSLFIRLLALYFAIYIISRIDSMTDIVDGTTQTQLLVKIFVIIGALMFAKDLPKILEGLGIKLDGDGKFFLNPFKKFEERAIGGKNITGLARGAMVGAAGAASGAGFGRIFSGAWRGMTSGKGWKETGKAEAEMNRKMRQARLDGSTWAGRLGAGFAAATGFRSETENIAREKHRLDEGIREHDDVIKANQARKKEIEQKQKIAMDEQDGIIRKSKVIVGSSGKAKETMIEKLKSGKGQAGLNYNSYSGIHETLSQNFGKKMTFDSYTKEVDANGKEYWKKETVTRKVTQEDIDNARLHLKEYEEDYGWRDLTNEMLAYANLDASSGEVDWDSAKSYDAKMATNLKAALDDIVTLDPNCEDTNDAVKKAISEGKGDFAAGLKKILGENVGAITTAEQQKREIQEPDVEELDRIAKAIDAETVEKEKLEEQKRALYEAETASKADETAIK